MWEERDSKSVIDYTLISTSLYDKYKDMLRDELEEMYDLSDHNLIQLRLKKRNGEKCKLGGSHGSRVLQEG